MLLYPTPGTKNEHGSREAVGWVKEETLTLTKEDQRMSTKATRPISPVALRQERPKTARRAA